MTYLKFWLQENHVSYSDVARRAKTLPFVVSQIANERMIPTAEEHARIAAALGIDPSLLLERVVPQLLSKVNPSTNTEATA